MRRPVPALSLIVALFLTGCIHPLSTDRRAYALYGDVVAVRPARHTLLIHHEEIPDLMPEMTMEFAAPGSDLANYRAGQRLTARMTEGPSGQFVLNDIRVLDSAAETAVVKSARELRERMRDRASHPSLREGEVAPSFSLYDQNGAIVSFARFRGKRVVLNFIYTRCPVPSMCPASTARMAALQRLARQRGVTDLELVSITLDPAYDTPAVLKTYASIHGVDTTHFTFLTGPEGAIRDLLTHFRMIALRSENLWTHSLMTSVIDREGRLVRQIEGDDWEPADLLDGL